MYGELLETCGYTSKEIDKELPRVKRALDKAGLTEADAKRAQDRLVRYFQCGELKGMRLLVGSWFKEFVDLMLSGEEHDIRIYCELPFLTPPLIAAAKLARPDIHTAYESFYLFFVLGAFFGRVERLIEAGENFCLPPGVAHCACNQLKMGVRRVNFLPRASLVVSTGLYCDEAPKADELLEYYFGERVAYINRCQDDEPGGPLIQERPLMYTRENIDRCRRTMSEVIGREITDDHLMQAIMCSEELSTAIEEITELRVKADPQPLRIVPYQLLVYGNLMSVNLDRHDEKMEMVRVLHGELQQMVKRGEGVIEKGTPKVVISVGTPLASPDYGMMIEDAGLNICCLESYGSGGALIDTGERRRQISAMDPCTILAAVYLTMPLVSNFRVRIECITNAYRKANLDGVLMIPHYSCRVLGNDSMMVKDGVKKELGNIPLLVLEGDYFDPRYYTAEQARTRVESFAEMVRSERRVAA